MVSLPQQSLLIYQIQVCAMSDLNILLAFCHQDRPHPFSQQPNIMGHTIRTVTARYTEWVSMSYPGGVHVANWSSWCGRELYVYGSPGGSTDPSPSAERRNAVDDPAMAATVAEMRKQLHAGWRVAVGGEAWPAGLPDVPQTQLANCGPAGMLPLPPTPPPPMCSGTPAQCIEVRQNVNFNEANAGVPGYPKVVATALACEEACLSLAECVSGLWLAGTVSHGYCFLTARLSAVPRRDFCGAKKGQSCVGFVRKNATGRPH